MDDLGSPGGGTAVHVAVTAAAGSPSLIEIVFMT